MTTERMASALLDFDLLATPKQLSQLLSYLTILLRWNEKMNLTAVRDPEEIVYRHFCESMFAAKSVPIEFGRLADVGSGAGLPGLPLKIVRPELEVFLIESSMKKAAFLLEVIRELGLTKTKVVVKRFEEIGAELVPLDFLCARALGEFDLFLRWAASDVVAARKVVLWVGGRDMEALQKHSAWNWKKPILLPHSEQRYLLVGERKQP